MARYVLAIHEFTEVGIIGPPIHARLIETDEDLSTILGYSRMLCATKQEVMETVLAVDSAGNASRLSDLEKD